MAAIFTKPTALDAAGAALAWLWLTRNRFAPLASAGLASLTVLIALAFDLASSHAFSLNVLLGNVNPFIPDQLVQYLKNFGLLHAVPIGLACMSLAAAWRARRVSAVELFFLIGIVAALGVGKWGAGESYFLSAIVASSILQGRWRGRCCDRTAAVPGCCRCCSSFSVPHRRMVSSQHACPRCPIAVCRPRLWRQSRARADLERGYGIVTRLRETPGDGLIQDPGFSLAAGKPVIGNATHLRNLHEAGLWPVSAWWPICLPGATIAWCSTLSCIQSPCCGQSVAPTSCGTPYRCIRPSRRSFCRARSRRITPQPPST